MLTAVGGGVVRDVLVNTVPGVLTSELYAVSALVGATLAAVTVLIVGVMDSLPGMTGVIASFVGGAAAIVLRLLSYWRGWELPRPKFAPRDDPPANDEAR